MQQKEVKIDMSELDKLYWRTYGFAFPQSEEDKKLIEYYKSIGKIKE